jgi:5-methyltetrahydrofolate--homocysteine methyltransferase
VEGPLDFDEIRKWLNLHVLLGKHLGLRGSVPRLLEQGDEKAVDLLKRTMAVADRAGESLAVSATWRFFPVVARGDAIHVLERPGGVELARFDFPRQPSGERLCLADFAVSDDASRPDFVALFVTTCGVGLREKVRDFMDAGDYFEAHALQSLAIEGAEAAAEWLHARLRRAWGFADPPDLALADAFKARYRGLRVSFGYPACPRLEDQATLFELLSPASIGVSLTEGFMMEPEASVSALVFHHPEARYFSA